MSRNSLIMLAGLAFAVLGFSFLAAILLVVSPAPPAGKVGYVMEVAIPEYAENGLAFRCSSIVVYIDSVDVGQDTTRRIIKL